MALEKKEGLSLSDFGDIRREEFVNGKFSYALIRYGSGVCLINSQQWFDFFKNSTVVPGSITIELDFIMKYELDAQGARVIGEDGKPKLIKTDRKGWQVTAAKGLQQLQGESVTKTQVDLLPIQEKTALLTARNNYDRAVMEASKYQVIDEDLRAKIEAHLMED